MADITVATFGNTAFYNGLNSFGIRFIFFTLNLEGNWLSIIPFHILKVSYEKIIIIFFYVLF